MSANQTRRKLCRFVCGSAGMAFMALPVISVCTIANAKTNSALRDRLKYQDKPKNGNSCTSCLEFTPGQTDQKVGTCKVIPGDDEISADGYCDAWNTM